MKPTQADLVTKAILGCDYRQRAGVTEAIKDLLTLNERGMPTSCRICGKQWANYAEWIIDKEH